MTDDPRRPSRPLQMRLVVEVDDHDEAVRFYRDVLGAPVELEAHGDGDERVTILDVGRATLELSNRAQVEMIDEVEVGRRVAPRLRVAFEVTDTGAATDRLVAGGAEPRRPAHPDALGLAQRPARGPGRPAADAVPGARRVGRQMSVPPT